MSKALLVSAQLREEHAGGYFRRVGVDSYNLAVYENISDEEESDTRCT